MASDVVRVRLRGARVLGVRVDTPSELVVGVESAARRRRCPACGFGCARVHGAREREIRDLGVSGRRVALVWMRRRFRCEGCEHRWLEDHPGFDGRLTRRLAAGAEVVPVMSAARLHALGRRLVMALVRAWPG